MARVEDFVVFVPFVAPGEVVEAEVTEVKKRFARARLLRVVVPSAERVEPLCPYFGECGGCQYQHLAYPAQLRLKHKQIAICSNASAGLTRRLIAPVMPCPQPYGYRNRIMIRSQWDKFKQGLNIGFIRADNRLVVDLEECKIAEPALNEQIKYVRAHPPPKGGIKVVLRIPPPGWEVPPDSFFQNNFFLLPKLVEVVGDRLRQGGTRHLVDVFCGVGFFSIELARPGRVLCRGGIGRIGDQGGAPQRRGARAHQRRIRGRRRGGIVARRCWRVSPRRRRPCCSTRRARAAGLRRCSCCAGCGRRRSFMSPATRRRWRGT